MVLFMTRTTPRGGNLAERLDGYMELVTEYNEAIKETIEVKDD